MSQSEPAPSSPNIILVVIDDLGWRDLTCYRSSFYETPHLDQLAAEGMRFTDAYSTCPVCSPSRASLLTGKYPARLGVTDWIDFTGRSHPCRGLLVDVPYIRHLPLTEKTIASSLREANYQTWHVGKWHLGGKEFWPEHHGFDLNLGGCDQGLPMQGYFSPWNLPTLADAPEGTYLTDHLTDEAIRLVQESGERPFFLNLWHYAVHTPIQAPPELVEKYQKKARDLGLDQLDAFEEGEFFPTAHKQNQRVTRRIRQSDPVYAAMMENLDTNIGRLRAALAASGKAENTVFVFTSDNGGLATAEGSPTCNHPLNEGKGWVYEGGTRVPLIIQWPGVTSPGSVCHVPVTGVDLAPTLLAAADLTAQPGEYLDGESLVRLLSGTGTLQREALYWHYPHYGNQGGTPASAIRVGDWKLIEFFEDERLELYHLANDPSEQIESHAAQPEITRHLHSLLTTWRQELEARLPERNPDWKPRS